MGRGNEAGRNRVAGGHVGLACIAFLALSACGAGSIGPGPAGSEPEAAGSTAPGGGGGGSGASNTASVAPSEGAAAAFGTVELDGTIHQFSEPLFCSIEPNEVPPVRATFGDELLQDPSLDALIVGRAGSSDTRIIVELGTDRWDTRLSDPPQISGGTATWESIAMGSVEGTGDATMTITISCG
jgi:hypothetical protein